jgi:hypothetical protein
MRARRSLRWGKLWVLLLPLLAGPSCSRGGRNPVHGKVLVKGSPVKGAVVVFHPRDGDQVAAQRPSAVTDEEGSFTLRTGLKEGAASGVYDVTVIWPEEPSRKKTKVISTAPPERDQPDRLKGRYASPKDSGLEVTVRGGTNHLEPFQLR